MERIKNICYIIGCGSLGCAIADELSKNGESVVIFDKDKEAFDKIPDSFGGKTIECDMTDINILNDSNINNSKLVVISTNDENTNIFLAHVISKLFNVKMIIVRLNTTDKKELIADLRNVQPIFPFELSVEKFNDTIEELSIDD